MGFENGFALTGFGAGGDGQIRSSRPASWSAYSGRDCMRLQGCTGWRVFAAAVCIWGHEMGVQNTLTGIVIARHQWNLDLSPCNTLPSC